MIYGLGSLASLFPNGIPTSPSSGPGSWRATAADILTQLGAPRDAATTWVGANYVPPVPGQDAPPAPPPAAAPSALSPLAQALMATRWPPTASALGGLMSPTPNQ